MRAPGAVPTGRRPGVDRAGGPRGRYRSTVNDLVMVALELLPA